MIQFKQIKIAISNLMLRSCNSNLFTVTLSSIIEHFKFFPNLLDLFFVAVRLEDVHGPFEISPGICDFHRNVYGPKEFESACSLKGVLSENLNCIASTFS